MEGTTGEHAANPKFLVCVECGEEADVQAHRWRGYLTIDGEVGFFCPKCAEREFDEDDQSDDSG